ncbi:endonuclease/exonuclease/phosphatase family protein [Marixanthomonas ophiurae]|uniref:Endonuclease/exonuclease/phosphatase family protein n=1 Tax=Marixanthomonas ophiurae TaxID=387659 RepID=A0A3E1QA70_9FLAO|nr:endonuclease/exonuclease/phosphatase family protein [Marixanthomonas ophiurae]RFN59035.1 endonuclease/exonuclease/phosphatase family protein [Marixanthomonas ophiurae]
MKFTYYYFVLLTLYCTLAFSQETKKYKINTIAFYNLENLYDTEDDTTIYDESSPMMEMGENVREEVYKQKLSNMAKVISEIGEDITGTSPAIIGVSEIENKKVVEDLVNQEPLLNKDYGIIQFDSPDRRGIDVAFLYQKKLFIPTNYKAHPLLIYYNNDRTRRIYTRDQLLVSGMLDGEKIHFIVNHWPSRSGGEARSRPKRIKAAKLNKQIIDSLFSQDPYAKIITMGDLNDDPTSPSVKEVLKAKKNREDVKLKELYNPMEEMHNKGIGTLAWRDSWNLFDQIILSKELLKKDYSSYRFYKAGIFNKSYLANPRGRYKGYPYRSFANGFTGGYSDHFPVYVYLIKEVSK